MGISIKTLFKRRVRKMYTKEDLFKDLKNLGIEPESTILIHSSMKSIGEFEGRAEGFLDALSEYFKDGLLVFPTHTWDRVNKKHPVYDVKNSECCVGLLPELFRKRPNVVRSLHPTHSVAALGKDAKEFVSEDHLYNTPIPRKSAWGKLIDRDAYVLFLGTHLTCNTFIHGVEEWCEVPGRLTDYEEQLISIDENGNKIAVPQRRHVGEPSNNYGKLLAPFLYKGVAKQGKICDAKVVLCKAKGMYEVTKDLLKKDEFLFSNNKPVPEEWYKN